MVNNDILSILSQDSYFEVTMRAGCTPKCDFNGNLHVAPEQIERVSCCYDVLIDRKWYTPDGKSLILKPVSIEYIPAVSEQNKRHRWEVVEEAKINVYFSAKGGKKQYDFSIINGIILERFIRNQIFKGGRITQKRLDTVLEVMKEQPEYLLVSYNGGFTNFDFDSICAKVQKKLKIK